jgi:o-succinylbenzoate---CoA ligase
MVNKSPRELLQVPSAWSTTHTLEALDAALRGAGPALAFGPTRFTEVEEAIAVVIPTSGSTGSAKEVALTADALMASASASHQYLGAGIGERWSLFLPTHHIAGVNVLVRALALQSEISESNFEYTSIVPTQLFRALQERGQFLLALQSAKAVLVGGAATSPELLSSARESGINVVTTYGMSEMSGGCVYNNEPLPGVEVGIRDSGAIALRGPMQASQYLGSTLELLDDEGWFVTSDAGYLENGKLYVTGRLDDQIISGGEKISLGALDNFLNGSGAMHYMSCAIAHPEWGEQLCLASSQEIDQSAISRLLREKFGNHSVPKLFLSGIELPLTSLGKPDRRQLAERFERIL